MQIRQDQFLDAYQRRGGVDDIIEVVHELTKLKAANSFEIFRSQTLFEQPVMQSIQHMHDRDYPLHPRIQLPEPAMPDRLFGELIRGRRSCRAFGGEALSLAQVSTLLFGANGETGRLTTSFEDENPIEASLRSIPSAGALHPTSVFVVTLREGELARGFYNYDVQGQALEVVKEMPETEIETLLRAFPIHPQPVNLARAAVIVFIASRFWRPRAKYGPRGYRYCLQEAGAACQNLCLTATALGLPHVVLGGFYDDEVHAVLEVDGVDQAVITSIAVGTPTRTDEEEQTYASF
jgi:SagB-type dehydrogenase family enzyme